MDAFQHAVNVGMPTAAVAVSATALLIVCTLLYRLKFHPLAGYPGPLLAQCTSWYAAYQSYTGNIHRDIVRCHQKYGDIVRYRPNGLVFNNVEGLHDIYAKSGMTKKSIGYHVFGIDGAISILSALDKDEHGPRRRILSRAFSIASLQKYAPLIYEKAAVFCDTLLSSIDPLGHEKSWGSPLDIGRISSYFTFDVMSRVVFYTPQDLMKNEKGREIIREIDSAMCLAGVALEQPLILGSPFLRRLLFRTVNNEADEFARKSKEFAMNRVSLGKDRTDDIFGSLLQQEASNVHQGLSTAELASDGAVMMVGGTDTSSVAISSALFYISRDSAAYAKLASEIRTSFVTIDEIRPGPKLTSCSYLRACIDEALRLAPPAPAPLWREIKNEADAVGGVVLPKGTEVATCLYSIQRNPAYFPDPDNFNPQRWLSESQAGSAPELSKKAFAPFSLGSRGCIGKNLAYMEISTLLAQIIYQTDFKAAEGELGKVGETHIVGVDQPSYRLWSHFTSGKQGPFLQFTRRSF